MTADGVESEIGNNAGALSEIFQLIESYAFGTVGTLFLVVTVVGIVLGFSKRAVFYTDYNDLGVSAGMFALPALIIFAAGSFVPQTVAIWIAGIVLVGLLVKVSLTTYRSNNGSIWKTIVIVIAKTFMSFLFVFHLVTALTAKKRSERGGGWFVLVILTPLLIALVNEKKGVFSISSTGRLQTR